MWYVLVFILGIIVGAVQSMFIVGCGTLEKEHEAYKEGYAAGMANANKNKEV
jgi:hypothetical protein